jgi:hypothetical protein
VLPLWPSFYSPSFWVLPNNLNNLCCHCDLTVDFKTQWSTIAAPIDLRMVPLTPLSNLVLPPLWVVPSGLMALLQQKTFKNCCKIQRDLLRFVYYDLTQYMPRYCTTPSHWLSYEYRYRKRISKDNLQLKIINFTKPCTFYGKDTKLKNYL